MSSIKMTATAELKKKIEEELKEETSEENISELKKILADINKDDK